jgi:16S rRNA (uracil1498-N3)-methyltransferase
MPRIYCSHRLSAHTETELPSEAAKHCQVLRLQPLDALTLFDGFGGEYPAQILEMGRHEVRVKVHGFEPIERENKHRIHLIVGMPANERMDWLVEKATELGVWRITPVMTTRSVLRLNTERAVKKQLHWRGIALAACAQSARNRIPIIDEPCTLESWCASSLIPEAGDLPPERGEDATDQAQEDWPLKRKLLSTRLLGPPPVTAVQGQAPEAEALQGSHRIQVVSGPEGGLTQEEEMALMHLGFEPCSLGARVLRAETAPMVALMLWGNV